MERKIMIFSDSLRLRRDAWRYAVALTQRLNSELILLLLLSPPVDDGMSPVKVIESISMMNEDARAAVNGYLSSLK